MKMKKYLFYAIVMTAMVSCQKERVTGSGSVSTEQRNVSGFSSVNVSGSSNVFITEGSAFDVKVKAYSNLIPYLETKFQNGTLLIAYKSNSNVRNDNSEVYITMPALTGLTTSGSGNISCAGDFSGIDNLNASVSGSGNISIENGDANNFKITISGSGDVKSFGLSAKQADVNISGSGNVELTVLENLKASINGSGNIYYKGNTPIVNSHISGSGQVIKQ
jgi:carbon monoxide dehydrogenase subunit G